VFWRKNGDVMYDIYLSMGCRGLPSFEDLAEKIPIVQTLEFQQKILTPSPHHPGFLGLDLSEPVVKLLFQRLQSTRAVGYWLLSDYRQPRITREQARLLAEPAIAERAVNHFQRHPDDTLGPIEFVGVQPEFWVFGARSEYLIRENCVPGDLRVSVDTLDGHIWTREDFDRRAKRLGWY